MKPTFTPLTIPDRPDAIVDGSALGPVTWKRWCEVERIRLAAHGLRAVVARNSSGTRIFVAVVRPRGGAR